MDAFSGVYSGWQQLLLGLLNDECFTRHSEAELREELKKAARLAESDSLARGSLLPLQIHHALHVSKSSEELVLAVRLLISTLVSPAWAKCSSCGARRLLKRPLAEGFFVCGDASALFVGRSCRCAVDQCGEDEQFIGACMWDGTWAWGQCSLTFPPLLPGPSCAPQDLA